MTLTEAKELYFKYDGSLFHMEREEPLKYRDFAMLALSEELLKAWDEEMLDKLFAGLYDDSKRIWANHALLLKVIGRKRCDSALYLKRLLKEMEKMETLDLFTKTLILENMAGRDAAQKDGGVYLFAQYPQWASEMNAILQKVVSYEKQVSDERFDRAVQAYRNAYQKWCMPRKIEEELNR